jgi:hypothetical protein
MVLARRTQCLGASSEEERDLPHDEGGHPDPQQLGFTLSLFLEGQLAGFQLLGVEIPDIVDHPALEFLKEIEEGLWLFQQIIRQGDGFIKLAFAHKIDLFEQFLPKEMFTSSLAL